jgi:hypothetical protein
MNKKEYLPFRNSFSSEMGQSLKKLTVLKKKQATKLVANSLAGVWIVDGTTWGVT